MTCKFVFFYQRLEQPETRTRRPPQEGDLVLSSLARLPKQLRVHVSSYWRKAVEEVLRGGPDEFLEILKLVR